MTRRLSENGYFSRSLRQAEIIILEILHCIPLVIISAFLDLEKNISFSDSLLENRKSTLAISDLAYQKSRAIDVWAALYYSAGYIDNGVVTI